MSKWHFSSNSIKQLAGFTTQEKALIIAKAFEFIETPQRLALNLIKLVCLIAVFMCLARQEYVLLFISVIASLATFFGVIKPLQLKFIEPKLDQAIKTLKLNLKED